MMSKPTARMFNAPTFPDLADFMKILALLRLDLFEEVVRVWISQQVTEVRHPVRGLDGLSPISVDSVVFLALAVQAVGLPVEVWARQPGRDLVSLGLVNLYSGLWQIF